MSSSPSELQETDRSEIGPLNDWRASVLPVGKRPHPAGLVLLKLDGVAIWLVD